MSNLILPKMFGQQLNLGHWSTEGLVFYWRGIQAEKVWDESLFGNHGTITGATWVVNGLNVNADGEYIALDNTGNTIVNSESGTIIMRVKSNVAFSDGVVHNLFGHRTAPNVGDFYITKWSDNSIYFVLLSALSHYRVYASSNFPNWQTGTTLAFVWNRTSLVDGAFGIAVYVDGKVISSTSQPNADTWDSYTIDSDMYIANNEHDTTQDFDGIIEHTSIYNRALSASEIAALYLNPDLPMQQPPIWLFTPPPVVGAVPKGPLGHPLYGPFAGPIVC